MASVTLDVQAWAEEQFGQCQLGDRRRTKRAVKVAAQVAANPSGSTPNQTEDWSDCKAVYRLFDQEDVTFEALASPHWRLTCQRSSGHYLLLGDTTTVVFGKRQVKGLGPTGDGRGRGFFLHSSMMVAADSEEVFGLAGQEIYYRRSRPAGESRSQRLCRQRESEVWGRVIEQVGPPAEDVRFTHVFDRGADNFEVYCRLLLNRSDWVIRASQLHRKVLTPEGRELSLRDYVETLPVVGSYTLSLRAQQQQPAREAQLEVRVGMVSLPAPKQRSRWLKRCGIQTIGMWVVEVREVGAPKGVSPLRWVLYSSHPATCLDEAWKIIGYYEKRPMIEEFHKAFKTGCSVEERQYQTSERLEAVAGLLSVMAIRLLQLRAAARSEPERPAASVVPRLWIEMLQHLRRRPRRSWTIREFYRHLAGLGGFLGRKGDGEPGWITLWRGFQKLAVALRASQYDKNCG